MKKALKAMCLAVMVMAVGNVFGQDELIPFSEDENGNEKWGYKDESGKVVIEPQYYYAYEFTEGLAAVAVTKDNYGYIDNTGKTVIQPEFSYANEFMNGLAIIGIGNWPDTKYGIIDKTGKMIVQPVWDSSIDVPRFQDGLVALMDTDGKKTLINCEGKTIVEFPSDATIGISDDFKNGWGLVRINDKCGIVDKNGWVKEPQFDYLSILGNIAHVQFEKGGVDVHGVLKKDGKWVIEPAENVSVGYDFYDGLCVAQIGDRTGYLNEDGWYIKPKYEDGENFSEGLAAVKVDEVWGFIDKTGKMVIEPQYEIARFFGEGLAAVMVDSKWGYIDKSGKMVIQPRYFSAYSFENGKAKVSLWEDEIQDGYVDRNGNFTPDEE